MGEPINVSEVGSFLGMMNHLHSPVQLQSSWTVDEQKAENRPTNVAVTSYTKTPRYWQTETVLIHPTFPHKTYNKRHRPRSLSPLSLEKLFSLRTKPSQGKWAENWPRGHSSWKPHMHIFNTVDKYQTATTQQLASSPQSALPTRLGTYTRSGCLSVLPRWMDL